MDKLNFLMQVGAVSMCFFILGLQCALLYVESIYKNKLLKILMIIFWGLATTILAGGFIYQIFEYNIKTVGG